MTHPTAKRHLFQQWFKRRAGSSGYRWLLTNRNIYILPTRYGLLFAVMVGVLLLFAMNYANNLIYLLAFSLSGIGVMGILLTYRNLSGLTFRYKETTPNYAGKNAKAVFMATNPDARSRVLITINHAKHSDLEFSLAAAQETTVNVPIATEKRGVFPLERCRVASVYPFGLFRAWAYLYPSDHYAVYPTPEHNAPKPQGLGAEYQKGKRYAAGDADFSGQRPYRQGDALSRVYWPSLAKGQALQLKEFATPHSDEHIIRWDQTRGLDTEHRLSRLCQWVLWSDAQRIPFGLSLPQVQIPPASGHGHTQRCLMALAQFGTQRP